MKSYEVMIAPGQEPFLQQFVAWEKESDGADTDLIAKATANSDGGILLFIQAKDACSAHRIAVIVVEKVRSVIDEEAQKAVRAYDAARDAATRNHANYLDRFLNWLRGK